jgi:O-methyltransferase involved in polyketide biosynthesis
MLTTRYLTDHPDATVLHLGCGLDSRVFRIDPSSGVHWFDVDYPDVVCLRRQLFPERADCRLIGSRLEDLRWLDETPTDRPVLTVAEGVLPYLAQGDVKALLNAITQRFPGGQVVFDAMPSWIVRSRGGSNVGTTGATYRWALDNPSAIKQLERNLELVDKLTISERVGYSRLQLAMRVIVRAMEVFPALRRYEQVLVFRF